MQMKEKELRKIIREAISEEQAPDIRAAEQDAGEKALDGITVKTKKGKYTLLVKDGKINLTFQSKKDKEPKDIPPQSGRQFYKGIAHIISAIRRQDKPKDPANMDTDNRTGALNRIIFKMFPENDMGAILRRIIDYLLYDEEI